jgi:predicted site-specific integrase-resolvase
MKLSAYARQIGVTYKIAYRWWKAGKLDAYQLDTGTVIVRDPLPKSARGVALYARVSSVDQKSDLERQMERLKGLRCCAVYTREQLSPEDYAAFLARCAGRVMRGATMFSGRTRL